MNYYVLEEELHFPPHMLVVVVLPPLQLVLPIFLNFALCSATKKMNLCTLKINLPVSLPEPVAGWY
jgi:hypothetical protein